MSSFGRQAPNRFKGQNKQENEQWSSESQGKWTHKADDKSNNEAKGKRSYGVTRQTAGRFMQLTPVHFRDKSPEDQQASLK